MESPIFDVLMTNPDAIPSLCSSVANEASVCDDPRDGSEMRYVVYLRHARTIVLLAMAHGAFRRGRPANP
jgi:hypothetical protein